MASESSSAMLDLNDADTEDTEPPSVTDDFQDGLPLIMEHGYDIAVKVDAPMKQLSTLETFVTYRVRCVCARWPAPRCVRRRYNHFKLLHRRLAASSAWVAPPPLPPLHTARQQLDRYSAGFVSVRTRALHAFLDRVAKHPIFTHNDDFRLFLTTPDDDFDKVFKSENSALNLWGLSSAIYGGAENKPPANGARVKDPEWAQHAEYLSSLQHKLEALASLTTKLQKGTLALTAEMMTMKRVCDAWSAQSRGAVARGAGAVAAGAAPRHPRLPPAHRAVLPLLAAYAAAHLDRIRLRDRMHAAYVSGSSATGDMHNKLEQCSEALRSELADWGPKTRADLKGLLADLADTQVNLHQQSVANWEHALRLAQDAQAQDLFKTVSRSAVRALSPAGGAGTTPGTERGGDHTDDYSNDSDDVDRSERTDSNGRGSAPADGPGTQYGSDKGSWFGNERGSAFGNERGSAFGNERGSEFDNEGMSEFVNEGGNGSGSELKCEQNERSEASASGSEKTEWVEVNEINNDRSKVNETSERENGSGERSESEKTEWVEVSDVNTDLTKDPLNVGISKVDDEFLNNVLEDTAAGTESASVKRPDVGSEPVKEFSDVDLS